MTGACYLRWLEASTMEPARRPSPPPLPPSTPPPSPRPSYVVRMCVSSPAPLRGRTHASGVLERARDLSYCPFGWPGGPLVVKAVGNPQFAARRPACPRPTCVDRHLGLALVKRIGSRCGLWPRRPRRPRSRRRTRRRRTLPCPTRTSSGPRWCARPTRRSGTPAGAGRLPRAGGSRTRSSPPRPG